MNHTHEPWSFGHLGMEHLWIGPDYTERPVALVPHDTEPAARDESRENARRIVACVNACAGLTTEALERELADERGFVRAFQRQRDELIEHLSCVLDFWGESGSVGKMVGGAQAYRDAHKFMDQCDAAITNATK